MLILNYSLLYTTESEEEEPDANEKMAANEDEAMNEDPVQEEDTTEPVANANGDQNEDTEVAAAAPGKSGLYCFYTHVI